MSIKLTQAPPQEVGIYSVWMREPDKKQALPYALTLFKMNEVRGERTIEGYPPVAFRASWRSSSLPTDINTCKFVFEGAEEMAYEIQLSNHEFMNYLADVTKAIHGRGVADFPQAFYSKLFRIKLEG
jgi:hypothetical protein